MSTRTRINIVYVMHKYNIRVLYNIILERVEEKIIFLGKKKQKKAKNERNFWVVRNRKNDINIHIYVYS